MIPRTPQRQTSDSAQPSASGQSRRALAAFAALRTGVTAFAALAGLACYFILGQVGVSGIPAIVIGLIFALLVRVAALSLLREWLLAAARCRARQTPPSPPSPTAPPSPPRG
jgi:fatty acid desaturase